MKVLVVSNDPLVQPLVESAILAEDTAAFVSNVDERVERAHEEPCDLIVLDRDIPHFDALLARLREKGRKGKIPVVILSMAEPSQDIETDSGVDRWIRKPLSVDELRPVLSRFRNPVATAPPTADEDLRDEYLRDCRERIARTGRILSLLQISPHNEALLQELRTEVHKIAGSAGTFGFPEASTLANVLERALDELV
ncbi:MAG: Hpt domain-containing protein, partial [Acidobacteria bacterium]|nr:Hpt domain-containing protein [Acidobacteriota bacterium]